MSGRHEARKHRLAQGAWRARAGAWLLFAASWAGGGAAQAFELPESCVGLKGRFEIAHDGGDALGLRYVTTATLQLDFDPGLEGFRHASDMMANVKGLVDAKHFYVELGSGDKASCAAGVKTCLSLLDRILYRLVWARENAVEGANGPDALHALDCAIEWSDVFAERASATFRRSRTAIREHRHTR